VLALEQVQDLLCEERIPVRDLGDASDEPVRRLPHATGSDQRLGLHLVETRELEPVADLFAPDAFEDCGEMLAAFEGTQRAEQEQAKRRAAVGGRIDDVGEQIERCGIGPVEVLEHDESGPIPRECEALARHRVEEPKALHLRFGSAGCVGSASLPEQAAQRSRRRRGILSRGFSSRKLREQRLEEQVGERQVLPTASVPDAKASAHRVALELAHEARLADPRFALEQDQLGLARRGDLEALRQPRVFRGSAYEGGRGVDDAHGSSRGTPGGRPGPTSSLASLPPRHPTAILLRVQEALSTSQARSSPPGP
jgi:hypothetical protein